MTLDEYQIDSDIARSLVEELDTELMSRYETSSVHGVNAKDFIAAGGKFFVMKIDEDYVGCGALRPIDSSSAEIKRIFVRKTFRGKGFSKHMINHLESLAINLGYSQILVETGDRQPEAQSLFRSNGYFQIQPFGEYVDDPHSICFKKKL